VSERTILADCCEEWILHYGRYHHTGDSFVCMECGVEWKKMAPGCFRRNSDGMAFRERSRENEGAEFRYLSAEDGAEPLVERCCDQILLRYGDGMAPTSFTCPICHTHWTRTTEDRGGLRVRCFRKDGTSEPFAIQTGGRRHFLVPLSSYRFPND
jgi:hypothetical protein